jgi:hypothetical protein
MSVYIFAPPMWAAQFSERVLLTVSMSSLWQYGLWSFQTGGTKLERFLHKNQHTQRKLLNFENSTSGGHQKLVKVRVFKADYFDFLCKKMEKLV